MNKINTLLVISSLTTAAASVHASELSIWGGKMSTKSDSVPYVYDSNTGNVIDSDLGRGTAYGLDFSTDVVGLTLGVGYAYSNPLVGNAFDTNPASLNDCNVNPVQGIISDCYDNASFHADTTAESFDLTIGKSFALGGLTLTPYGGARKFNYTQLMSGAYNYSGGYETTWKRTVDFNDVGPRLGVKLDVPFGASGFSVGADVSYAMFSASRKQNVNEVETYNGSFNRAVSASDSQTIKPRTLDVMVAAGYKVTSNTTLGLGYRYQKITKVIDNSETNSGGNLPASYSVVTGGDLTLKGVYANAKFAF